MMLMMTTRTAAITKMKFVWLQATIANRQVSRSTSLNFSDLVS